MPIADASIRRRGLPYLLAVAVACAVIPAVQAQIPPATPAEEPTGQLTIPEALDDALEAIQKAEDAKKAGDNQTAIDEANMAMRNVNYVLTADPINVTAGYVAARVALLDDRPREALSKLEAYVADPAGVNNWYARKLLGDIYSVSYAEHAKSQYERAVELAPNEPSAHIGLAKTLLKLNNYQKALESAERAISLDKENDPDYRAVRAQALLKIPDRLDDAIAAAKEAVRLSEAKVRANPGELKQLNNLAGQYDLLLNALDTTHSYFPERVDLVIEAAQVIQDKADLERLLAYHNALRMVESQLAYKQQKTEEAKLVDLLFVEARLDRIVGRQDKAVEILKHILELKPDYQPARELLDIIEPPEAEDVAASAG